MLPASLCAKIMVFRRITRIIEVVLNERAVVCFIINIMNYLELICNIDNFAVGKWFREVYAFRMKREPGENPGQYPLL